MKLVDLYYAYQPLVNRIITQSNGLKFQAHFIYFDPKIATVNDSDNVKYIHYAGIIERCHIACLTSLLRNLRWIEGSLGSIKNNNIHSFSANLRGLLEASSDSWDLMQYLPQSIFKLIPYFYMAIHKNQNISRIYVVLKELEDRLIHFSYARRHEKDEVSLPEHNNKLNVFYISGMEASGIPDIKELYSLLCQLTHPASDSLNCFIDIGNDELIG